MFITQDDYLIIMDMNLDRGIALTYDEMRLLQGAGVKTLYYQAAMRWDDMQPSASAPIDWSNLDNWVNMARRAGLKMLIPFVYSFPRWKPDEWFYSRERAGLAYGVPAYDSSEVAEELDDLMHRTIERYAAEDVQVIFSIPCNGELPLHLWTNHNQMDYPMGVFTDWVIARQKQLVKQHGEIWTAYHPYTRPEWWHPVYKALFEAYPDARHYGIMFTYVQRKEPHFHEYLRFNQERGMVYFGGTEYVQGMDRHVDTLQRGGLRMLTAPKHNYQDVRELSPWVLETMKRAIHKYEANNGSS